MDRVVRIFAGIADEMDCAIDLSHHTRKGPAGLGESDYAIEDMRGAVAVRDALRAVRILNFLSKADAEGAGVPELERTSYFRIDRGKGNYSAPAKNAVWRKFTSVDLPNGDNVGVVIPWTFPGADGQPSPEKAEADRKAENVFLDILRRLTLAGRTVSERGPNNAPHVFSHEREAKLTKVGKSALAAAMRRLFDAGRIRIESYSSAGHQANKIVEV